jgi:1,4-dihydroxy-2-naphthoyl-CoA hydrolase
MANDTASPLAEQPLAGWDGVLGIRIVRASGDEVIAEYEVAPRHHQGYGIVHGGVHCSAVETVCSTGAALDAMVHGRSVVGLENHTSFVRAVRAGKVTIRATPVTRGRRSQLWEAVARDEQGRIVSSGRVRLLCLEPGSELAGEPVGVKRE